MKLSLPPFFFFFLLITYISCIHPVIALVAVKKSVFVDQSGHGDFTSITAAIASVPSKNNNWIRIHVRPGVYKEKVQIPKHTGFIMLEGEGFEQTSVEWGDHVNATIGTALTSTFRISGDNIVVKNIAFKNTYDGGVDLRQALAVLVEGDKISFYDCGFYGIQDTICDFNGRHYYKNSYIQGAVDFIWGLGQSIFEDCTIASIGAGLKYGYITAQGRKNRRDSAGFVFKSCNVTGSLKTYLGRAWTAYSRVIFYQSYLDNIIIPQGWVSYNAAGKEWLTYYVEFGNAGPGSDTSRRVNWMKKLTKGQLKLFTNISYIDREGWLSQQP